MAQLPPAQALKEAIDDLRAYYLEAASAFPGAGTPATRKKWFWDETKLAEAMLALQPKLAASDDPQHKILGQPDADPGERTAPAGLRGQCDPGPVIRRAPDWKVK